MNLKYGPYSPSRLDTATCGYAFHRRYIAKDGYDKKEESLPAARGSVVHEIFEKMTALLAKNPDHVFSSQQIRVWVTEAVNRHPAAYQEVEDILKMAELYARKPPRPLEPDAGIELRLAIKFNGETFTPCDYDDNSAFARGRADIFMISEDTTYALVYDHKTQPNVEEADTFQMGFYAWVISKTYPFLDEIRTVLHFARYGMYSESYVWTRQDLAQIEDQVLARISIIENRQEWEATPNKHCQYCPYISECPAMAEFIEVDGEGRYYAKNNHLRVLGDTNKAIKVAGMVTVLSEVVNKGKEGVRKHVEQYGPIAIPGVTYEYRAHEKINWDLVNKKLRSDVYKVFEKHGVDPKVFMGFSETFTKSLWMFDKPELIKELASILPRKPETRFSGYKS